MITTFDDYIAAVKDQVGWIKTGAIVSVAARYFTLLDVAGNPGAGVLAAGNTANGQVPDRTTAGFPGIRDFAAGKKGYLTRVSFSGSVAERLKLVDRLFHAGAYNFNDNIVLTAQPDFSARVPNSNFKELSIWVEIVTALVGASSSVEVKYTNENGVANRTTGNVVLAALALRSMILLPLQAGDRGVQKIEQVIVSGGTGGTLNVLVLRELWNGRVPSVGAGDTHALDKTGLVEVPQNAALQVIVAADGTAAGVPEAVFEISQG